MAKTTQRNVQVCKLSENLQDKETELNPKNSTPEHMKIKLLNTTDKEQRVTTRKLNMLHQEGNYAYTIS